METMSEKITFRRGKLYEKVWTTPMSKLAKQVGLSDVGLAKLCRRNDIPLPGLGYWARLAAGQKLRRTPLPVVENGRPYLIEIYPTEKAPAVSGNTREIPYIPVADDRPITHSVAIRTDKFLLRTKKDERGLLLPRKGTVVCVRVSLEALPRALRILDAIAAAVEAIGHAIIWPKPFGSSLKVNVLGEELEFSISEVVERSEHKPTKEELARQKADYWFRPPQWDFTLTGHLNLEIHCNESLGVRRKWSDGKHLRVEDGLGRFVVGLTDVANGLKALRAERAEAARKREEQSKRDEAERRRKEEHERRAHAMTKLAKQWSEAHALRAFANALKESAKDPRVSAKPKEDFHAIADWILRHADYVDPLTDPAWTIDKFKNPPWHYPASPQW